MAEVSIGTPMIEEQGPNSAAQRYTDIRAYASQPLLRPNMSTLSVTTPPHLFGRKPSVLRSRPIIEEAGASTGSVKYCTFPNVLWTILVGWWCALFVALTGLLMIITIVGWPYGVTMLRLASYVFYPFGRYLYTSTGAEKTQREKVATVFLWFFASLIAVIPLFCGMFVSWELMFYIPMAKFMWNIIKIIFTKIHRLKVGVLRRSPKTIPLSLVYRSGAMIYFKHTIAQMEIPYLALFPLVPITLYMKYLAPEDSPIGKPIPGTLISIVASIPCMYVIGVCTEILSSRCGLVLGSFINAILTGVVELILFFFSLKQGLGEVVRAAVTGAFLMNLLVIPGLAMFAAGIKWKEVMINRKVQSVSGTFMFLAIVAVFFPAVFYNLYGHKEMECRDCACNETARFYEYLVPRNGDFDANCSMCRMVTLHDLSKDEIYTKEARPLMYAVSCLMPVVYFVGLFFSMKTHKYIYDQFEEEQGGDDHQQGSIPTWLCVIILAITCTLFSLVCEVLTEKIEKAIEQMGLTQRFAGLVFYTLIPAVAEFINAVRFALEGNMGLSLEIGNQGAMVVSLIQMPALVLISVIMGKSAPSEFTLMFEMIDVFAVIISVLLRNFMLMDKSINYFTGFAFLVIFLLIAMVYYYDEW